MLKILGFDPSLRNWGVAAATLDLQTDKLSVRYMDVVQPIISKNKQVRVNNQDLQAAEQLYAQAHKLAKQADVICIEVPHGSQSARAMASYGICIGVIGSLRHLGIPIIELSAMEVKQVLGKKDATKAEIIAYVQQHHPEAPIPSLNNKINFSKAEHACDAVVAIHAAKQTDLFKVLRTAKLGNQT